MKPSHIEHIGIAVCDLQTSIDFYENVFGLKCYNIEKQLKHAEKQGVKLIDAFPRKGAEGLEIAFFHPK